MTGTFVLTRGAGVQASRVQLKKYWSYIKLATLRHTPDQMTSSALLRLFLQAVSYSTLLQNPCKVTFKAKIA